MQVNSNTGQPTNEKKKKIKKVTTSLEGKRIDKTKQNKIFRQPNCLK